MEKDCKQTLSLLEDIYETVHDSNHWNSILKLFASWVSDGKAAITARDNETGRVDGLDLAITSIIGIPEELIGKYVSEVSYYDEWIPIEVGHDYSTNPICHFSAYLPKEELIRSNFYRDWLKHLEITDGIAVQLIANDSYRVVLNVFFNDSSSTKQVQQLCKNISILAPHLRNAISFWLQKHTNYFFSGSQLRTKSLMDTYGVTERELHIVTSYIRTGSAKKTARECGIKSGTVHKNVAIMREKMNCANAQNLKMKLLSYSD